VTPEAEDEPAEAAESRLRDPATGERADHRNAPPGVAVPKVDADLERRDERAEGSTQSDDEEGDRDE
jgi:hypothetical protein